jgi:hypothetical protein
MVFSRALRFKLTLFDITLFECISPPTLIVELRGKGVVDHMDSSVGPIREVQNLGSHSYFP